MSTVVRIDPEIMSGTPCFAGTRVPVKALFDHFRLNYSVEEFLEQFPTVKKEQVDALLDEMKYWSIREAEVVTG